MIRLTHARTAELQDVLEPGRARAVPATIAATIPVPVAAAPATPSSPAQEPTAVRPEGRVAEAEARARAPTQPADVTGQAPTASEHAPLTRAADPGELRLTRLVGAGKPVTLLPGSHITLSLRTEGRVSGSASLNRYSGAYTLSPDGTIEWAKPGFVTTRMAGPVELMNQESLFLELLAKTTKLRQDASGAVLQTEDGSIVLTFSR